MDTSYSPPVSRLLTLGEEPILARQWTDYAAELGVGPEHVPELIRMATDPALNWADGDTAEVWAPLHAWRALGQLRAESAVEPLASVMDELAESDWLLEEFPTVFGLIGRPALPTLAAYLLDPSHDLWARVAAADGLKAIAEGDPSARSDAVNALAAVLRHPDENDVTLNGFLISCLVDLRAVGAAPLIERAFEAEAVDLSIQGDWEDVQVELGLLEARVTPPPVIQLFPEMPADDVALLREAVRRMGPVHQTREAKAKAKRKSRRAMAKAARRRNRGKRRKKR
jgi:hypothetical protein